MPDDANPKMCPKCGTGKVQWDYTCHTWYNGTIWMSCIGCDSAVAFSCADDCGWHYDWGLNPGNPRTVRNEAARPPWLTVPIKFDRYGLVTNMPDGVEDVDVADA